MNIKKMGDAMHQTILNSPSHFYFLMQCLMKYSSSGPTDGAKYRAHYNKNEELQDERKEEEKAVVLLQKSSARAWISRFFINGEDSAH